MRLLLSSDWQTDFQNLDLCERAWAEVMQYANQHKVDAIINAGDMKRSYNPVDLRVMEFWLRASEAAIQDGFALFFMLGNHDRIGQHDDQQNWFSLFRGRKSKAHCISSPGIQMIGKEEIVFLPFCRNKTVLREEAGRMARESKHTAVLIFHEDLKGCKYNQTGTRSQEGVDVEDLYPDVYLWCFGGHIHLHQKIGRNLWYIGSPFCQDWGEANQRKGYLLADTGERRLDVLPSKIPGWFDPSWPGFYQPESWKGAKVRIKVECHSATELISKWEKARLHAAEKYPGADLIVSPVFIGDNSGEATIKASDPDHVKIKQYVDETCPQNIDAGKATKYLQGKLEAIGASLRSSDAVRFLWARGENFLSFREVDIDFQRQGITVIQGKNWDRGGRSNGSGKTSYTQAIPVALFGTTFKGQKHDRWARRHAEGTASLSLALQDGRGRDIIIRRKRRPSELRWWIDGKPQDSGLNPVTKDATQGLIEKTVGFTWQTLANSVYIDREIAHAFLSGTKKERSDVLAKFQNLERFEQALKLVRADKQQLAENQATGRSNLEVLQERIRGYDRQMAVLIEEREDLDEEIRKRKKLLAELHADYDRPLADIESKITNREKMYNQLGVEIRDLEDKISRLKITHGNLRTQLKKLDTSFRDHSCPTCSQPVTDEMIEGWKAPLLALLEGGEAALTPLEKRLVELKLQHQLLDGAVSTLNAKASQMEAELRDAEANVKQLEEYRTEQERKRHAQGTVYAKTRRMMKKAQLQLSIEEEDLRKMEKQEQFLAYAERAFSRDGIPAFLNALLCPALNAACARYSELFCDSSVQVRFEIENGDFVPVIVNTTGGESIDDQSEGERALAGIIASFGLRDTTGKSNLLILDEPGAGLDPASARQFAVALKKLDYGAIYLTTHNEHILAELEREHTVTIEKKNGVSKVLCS